MMTSQCKYRARVMMTSDTIFLSQVNPLTDCGPLVDTLIYCERLKRPTFSNEPQGEAPKL